MIVLIFVQNLFVKDFIVPILNDLSCVSLFNTLYVLRINILNQHLFIKPKFVKIQYFAPIVFSSLSM